MSEAKRLRQLEEENRQLKYIVADQAVDIRALKALAVAFLFRQQRTERKYSRGHSASRPRLIESAIKRNTRCRGFTTFLRLAPPSPLPL